MWADMSLQEQRFGEVLSVAESLDVEGMKKAVRKSRVVFNRGGADDKPADTGEQQPHWQQQRAFRVYGTRPASLAMSVPFDVGYDVCVNTLWAAVHCMGHERALCLFCIYRCPCKVLP
jgi:hypothetical protein